MFKNHNENRVKALDWWRTIHNEIRWNNFTFKYFPHRQIISLTGREIELIYNGELQKKCMTRFEKCKVVILPTEKANKQRGILKCIKSFDLGMIDDFHNAEKEGTLFYGYHNRSKKYESWENEHWQSQHLYILSDEEIKEGDWYYYKHFGEDFISNVDESLKNKINTLENLNSADRFFRKIIATTDPSLNLPGLDDSFIKKYCELGGIGEVLVEYQEKEVDDWEPLILKVAQDSTITIKKLKDSWSREEVIDLIKRGIQESKEAYSYMDRVGVDKWIEQNL